MFAQYELGNAYRYGQGIDKDVLRAMEWYRLASESGNSSADKDMAGVAPMASRALAPPGSSGCTLSNFTPENSAAFTHPGLMSSVSCPMEVHADLR